MLENEDLLGSLLAEAKEEPLPPPPRPSSPVTFWDPPTEAVRFTGAQFAQLRAQIYCYRAFYKSLTIPEGFLTLALNKQNSCFKTSLSFTFDKRPDWNQVQETPSLAIQLTKQNAKINKLAPSQAPPPIDKAHVTLERNVRIAYRMALHVREIEKNLNLLPDNKMRVQAQITSKALRLSHFQRSIRQEVNGILRQKLSERSSNDVNYANLSKRQQKLVRAERQQKLEAERRKKQKAQEFCSLVLAHAKEFREFHKAAHSQTGKLAKAVISWHANNEREAKRQQEKIERERMQRLMAEDEAGYLAMIDEKKDKRLAFLLKQTDEFISNLVNLVKEHKEDAAERRMELDRQDREERRRIQAEQDGGERRISVHNPVTGEKIAMKDAPLESQLDSWLEMHPGFEPAPRDEDENSSQVSQLTDDDQARAIIEKAKTEEDDDYKRINDGSYYAIAHSIQEPVTKQPSIMINGELKEYQLKGIEWLVSLYNNNLNGILADEMGLGKTIQTIGLVAYLADKKKTTGPHIIVVPLATISNWQYEFEKWAPSLQVIVYKGSPQHRKNLGQQIKQGRFNVLLTTYEYIIKDKSVLSKTKWKYLIIDEGHRMKNHHCKLTVVLNTYYTAPHRLLLTGTPLQNKLPELWALLNFMLPNIFKSCSTFEQWFNAPFANTGEKVELNPEESLLIIRRLHKVLRPFLLRRLKKEVESQLPDKVEYVIKVEMSGLQRVVYRNMQRGVILTGEPDKEGGKGGGARTLMNTLMQLRKVCNHPFMFPQIEQAYARHIGLPENCHIAGNDLFRSSGKFELLDRILPKLKATGHRVLMFSQMTSALTILEDYFQLRQYKYLRLDGSTKSDDRAELLRKFQAPESDYFIFILSTRAGGLGLNLQSADTVIIFDSDWNPHQDLQAQDRAHRIGQKSEVRVFRLVTVNSVEERILAAARFKLSVDEKVIQAGKFDQKSTSNERKRFLQLLLTQQDDMEEEEDMEVPDDKAINEMMARSDEEGEIFEKMDVERAKLEKQIGLTHRLIQESELPEWLRKSEEDLQKITEEREFEELYYGRGARERKQVDYGQDSLTEDQWLREVLDEDTGGRGRKKRMIAAAPEKPSSRPDSLQETPQNSRQNEESVDGPSSPKRLKNLTIKLKIKPPLPPPQPDPEPEYEEPTTSQVEDEEESQEDEAEVEDEDEDDPEEGDGSEDESYGDQEYSNSNFGEDYSQPSAPPVPQNYYEHGNYSYTEEESVEDNDDNEMQYDVESAQHASVDFGDVEDAFEVAGSDSDDNSRSFL